MPRTDAPLPPSEEVARHEFRQDAKHVLRVHASRCGGADFVQVACLCGVTLVVLCLRCDVPVIVTADGNRPRCRHFHYFCQLVEGDDE